MLDAYVPSLRAHNLPLPSPSKTVGYSFPQCSSHITVHKTSRFLSPGEDPFELGHCSILELIRVIQLGVIFFDLPSIAYGELMVTSAARVKRTPSSTVFSTINVHSRKSFVVADSLTVRFEQVVNHKLFQESAQNKHRQINIRNHSP